MEKNLPKDSSVILCKDFISELDVSRLAISPDALRADFMAQAALREQLNRCTPELRELVEAIKYRITRPPYFAWVRGWPKTLPPTIFLALATLLGDVIDPLKTDESRLLQSIRPQTDSRFNTQISNNEVMHTDASGWPQPHALIGLFCVQDDQSGEGLSRILTLDSLRDHLCSMHQQALLHLMEQFEFPWHVPEFLGGGIYWAPVLTANTIRFLRSTVNSAINTYNIQLNPAALEALITLERLIESCPDELRFKLDVGDLLFLDNTRSLHGRTVIQQRMRSNRHLLRVRISRSEHCPAR